MLFHPVEMSGLESHSGILQSQKVGAGENASSPIKVHLMEEMLQRPCACHIQFLDSDAIMNALAAARCRRGEHHHDSVTGSQQS